MALQDDVRSLASNPTLRDLEPDALRLLAFSAETRILRAGDVLFRGGDASDSGYVVLSGAIALEADAVATQVARPPALIGDSALITETVRPCTALAREPSSVLRISRVLFLRVLMEYPVSAARVRRSLSHRVLSLCDDLERFRSGVT